MPPSINVRIYTDPSCLNHDWLFRTLSASYWGGHYTKAQILRAIDHSIVFGAYLEDPIRQIGFARAVSDRAICSIINDVIVDPGWRKMGVGTSLIQAMVEHPAIAPTICILKTRYANGLYSKFGFVSAGDFLKRDPR